MRHLQQAFTVALLFGVWPALSADALADSPTRLKWQCTEHEATRVVVNAAGELAREQEPASAQQPVQVRAIKLDPTAEGAEIPTRIISTEAGISADDASWNPGNGITSQDGRLRLDPTSQSLFLLTADFGNQALFRRFSCQDAGKDAPVHYQCGADFQLWVDFAKATDDQEPARAKIQYPGGQLTLPQVRSGSGARYASADSLLWIKGDSASFTLAGGSEHRCQVDD